MNETCGLRDKCHTHSMSTSPNGLYAIVTKASLASRLKCNDFNNNCVLIDNQLCRSIHSESMQVLPV